MSSEPPATPPLLPEAIDAAGKLHALMRIGYEHLIARAHSSARMARHLAQCRTPFDAIKVYQEWLSEESERIVYDMRKVADLSRSMLDLQDEFTSPLADEAPAWTAPVAAPTPTAPEIPKPDLAETATPETSAEAVAPTDVSEPAVAAVAATEEAVVAVSELAAPAEAATQEGETSVVVEAPAAEPPQQAPAVVAAAAPAEPGEPAPAAVAASAEAAQAPVKKPRRRKKAASEESEAISDSPHSIAGQQQPASP